MMLADLPYASGRRGLELAFGAMAAAVALVLIAGYLGRLHPFFDAFAHFRLHLAVVLGALALSLALLRRLRAAMAAGIVALVSIAGAIGTLPFAPIGPSYGTFQAETSEQPVYALMHLNLRFDNPDKPRVLSLIGQMQPDVITLNEVSREWATTLELIEASYPYSLFCPFPNRVWGVAILSRRPFTTGTQPACDARGAFGVASIDFGGRPLQVATVHLGWPWPFEQAWQLDGLADEFATLGDAALLAGDLNATPWSRSVARVAEQSGLALMPSPGATWLPDLMPRMLRFAGLPIDQVFAGPLVQVHGVRRLRGVGSDHWPLLASFSLGSAENGPTETGETATAMLGKSTDGH